MCNQIIFCTFAAKMRNTRFYIALLAALFLLTTTTNAATKQTDNKPFVVVIDAGHGGTDPGAIGLISQEKDLNLAVSLELGQRIKAAYPEVNVLYTRETDIFIPLQKRADFVNKNNANLFICIHTNSSPVAAAKGAETFVLGTDRLEKNLDVAMRENAVIKLEKDYQTAYHGFDPNSIDSYIMFELMQNQYLDQSLNYASFVQQGFSGTLKRGDRGVRQAAFWVLLKSACPSVLVEMGFISNPEEERFLASRNGQQQIAKVMFDAFGSFYKRATDIKVDTTRVIEQPASPAQTQAPAPSNDQRPTTNDQKPTTNDQNVQLYAVQIFASHEILPDNDPRFCGLVGCQYMQKGDWYKYYYGVTPDSNEAFKLQQQLKNKFPGCFVIKVNK